MAKIRRLILGLGLALCWLTPVAAKPNANKLCDQADAFLKQGKVRESLQKYEEALQADPHCARAYAARGTMSSEAAEGALARGDQATALNFYQHGISDLSKAIQYDPKDAPSWANRGSCYYRMSDFPKALNDFNHSLALKPNGQVYGSRAGCYTKLKRDENAVADYTKAYSLGHNANFLFNRGNAYLRLNQKAKAKADYEHALRESKDPRVIAGAKNNLEALKEGSNQLPTTAPNRPR